MSRSNHIQLIVPIGVFRSFSVNSIVYRMIRKTIEEIENSNNRFNINHWAGTVRRQQESLHNEKKFRTSGNMSSFYEYEKGWIVGYNFLQITFRPEAIQMKKEPFFNLQKVQKRHVLDGYKWKNFLLIH